MSNLPARAELPEDDESRPMQPPTLHAAATPPPAAVADVDIYGNTYGIPFAAWWVMVLTLLVTIGWMLEAQLTR